MISHAEASALLTDSEEIFSADEVKVVITQLARDIMPILAEKQPVVLAVMGGAVFLSGQLLPLLQFPLEFDYVQASRYHNQTQGQHLVWKMLPGENVRGRTVLLLDDILDEGHTLEAVKQKCLEAGAAEVLVAVLAEKDTGRSKPLRADFVGLTVPNRYVFGCGMDVHGWWRNLPSIRAVIESAGV